MLMKLHYCEKIYGAAQITVSRCLMPFGGGGGGGEEEIWWSAQDHRPRKPSAQQGSVDGYGAADSSLRWAQTNCKNWRNKRRHERAAMHCAKEARMVCRARSHSARRSFAPIIVRDFARDLFLLLSVWDQKKTPN